MTHSEILSSVHVTYHLFLPKRRTHGDSYAQTCTRTHYHSHTDASTFVDAHTNIHIRMYKHWATYARTDLLHAINIVNVAAPNWYQCSTAIAGILTVDSSTMVGFHPWTHTSTSKLANVSQSTTLCAIVRLLRTIFYQSHSFTTVRIKDRLIMPFPHLEITDTSARQALTISLGLAQIVLGFMEIMRGFQQSNKAVVE